MGPTRNDRLNMFGTAAFAIMAIIAQPNAWADQAETKDAIAFEIEAISLGDALRQFSAQSGTPILFSEADVAGRMAPAVQGEYARAAALARLLEGTGLEQVEAPGKAILVRRKKAEPASSSKPARRATADGAAPETVATLAAEPDTPDTLRIDSVTVTGTSLRGFAPESSPLQVFDRDDILGSGAGSTDQFMRTLAQNFSGGSTEFAASQGLPNDSNSQFNSTFGTGANLRGLGSRGTLTLLNGNRLAPTSDIGDFVDLSMIPISALERIDVLTDGASSIYGGDAVAGVVNFVLRDDFTGAETAARYGTVTQGSLQEYRFSQSLGTAWDSGNLLASYEYFDRGNLVLADRPDVAAPVLNSGEPIADTGAFDLLPEQVRHSGLLSLNQHLTPALKLSLTGLYSTRTADSTTVYAGSSATTSNYRSKSDAASINAGLDYEISPDWSVSLDTVFSQVRNSETARELAPAVSGPSRSTGRSELSSADLLVNGDLFALPGGRVRLALGGHVRHETFAYMAPDSGVGREGARDVAALYGELLLPLVGAGNARPGLQRLELNLSGRVDDFSDFGTTANPKIGALWTPVDGLNVRGSYSESFAPPPLGRTGDLNRTAVVYPYAVVLSLLGAELPDPDLAGVDYMLAVGTAADLDAETSRTFTAGFDYHHVRGDQSWRASFTYYDIAFEGRLGTTPMPQNQNANLAPQIVLADPTALPGGTVIFFPDADQIAGILADSNRPVIYVAGASSLDNIGIINTANTVRNLAATETRGLDLQLDYGLDIRDWHVAAGINANYITDFTQQAALSVPAVDVLNTLYNPVDLKLRANLGLSRGGLTGSLFVNHTDGYRTDSTPGASPVASWTTADLSLAYSFGQDGAAWQDGLAVYLSVTNLFDRSPPSAPTVGAFRITGYDPANASPIGRLVALGLRKTF